MVLAQRARDVKRNFRFRVEIRPIFPALAGSGCPGACSMACSCQLGLFLAEADLRPGSEGGIWDLGFLGSLQSQIR